MVTYCNYLANSVDPAQKPQNAVSDQDLHCLPLIHQLLDTSKDKWIRSNRIYVFLRKVPSNYYLEELIHLVDFPSFRQGRQLLWLPVCSTARRAFSEKVSIVKGKNLPPQGDDRNLVFYIPFNNT